MPLEDEERITAILALTEDQRSACKGYFVLATERGKIKRIEQEAFVNVRRYGLKAMSLNDGDSLRWIKWSNGDQKIVMATADGQSILFHEGQVSVYGRQAAGVMGMELRGDDRIAGMDIVPDDEALVLVVTRKGFGKRSPVTNYTLQNRAGFGNRTLKRNSATGPVIAVRCVRNSDEVMLISRGGSVSRMRIFEIREVSPNTKGVILMRFDGADEVAGIAIMLAEDQGVASESDNFSSNGATEES